MWSLFRKAKLGIGMAPFSLAELELLADIADGKIFVDNWRAEHPDYLYDRLKADGVIYFEQSRARDGESSVSEVFGIPIAFGRFKISPALPPMMTEAIDAHRRSRGPDHKSVRQLNCEREVARRAMRQVPPEIRRAILWHLAHDLGVADTDRPSSMYIPDSIDAPRVSVRAQGGRRSEVQFIDRLAVVEELMRTAAPSALLESGRRTCKWPLSKEWEVHDLNLTCKLGIVNELSLADQHLSNPAAAAEARRIRGEEKALMFAIVKKQGGAGWKQSVEQALGEGKVVENAVDFLTLTRAQKITLADRLNIAVHPDLRSATDQF